jgi:hypothetical protein
VRGDVEFKQTFDHVLDFRVAFNCACCTLYTVATPD